MAGRRGHGTPDALLDFDMPAVVSGTSYTTSNDTSDDSIDLEAATCDIGTGSPIYLRVQVGATAVTQTGTVIFSLQDSADNSSFANTEIVSATFTNGTGLGAGAIIIDQALPKTTNRYLQILATIATGNITAGSFEAFLYTD